MVDQNKNIDFSQASTNLNSPYLNIDFDVNSGGITNDPYSNYILTLQPVAYYKTDELSGTTAIDYTGNQNNATYVGTTTYQEPSLTLFGNSVSFDGDDHILIPTGIIQTGASVRTVELWAKKTSLVTVGQVSEVLYMAGEMTNGRLLEISLVPTGIQFNIQGTTKLHVLDYSNQTLHIVATYNGGILRGYINGTEVFSLVTTLDTSSAAHMVGQRSDGAYKLTGTVDNIAIYDKILNSYQIESNYSMGTLGTVPAVAGQAYVDEVLLSTPLLYWEFESLANNIVDDRSGNNLHGTVSGSWALDSGIFNYGLRSNEVDTKRIEAPLDSRLDNIKSVEFWFKDFYTNNSSTSILEYSLNNGSRWIIYGADGFYKFPSVYRDNGLQLQSPIDYRMISEWKHCVLRYDSNTGTSKFYIDGIEQTVSYAGNIFATAPGGKFAVGSYLYNGAPYFAGGPLGNIDAVAAYDTSITTDAIGRHYQIGKLGYLYADNYEDLIVQLDPIAHYRLDELTGTVATDSTTNDYHGEYIGGLQTQTGLITNSTAASFDSTHSMLVDNTELNIAGDITTMCWINIPTASSSHVVLGCMQPGESLDANALYYLAVLGNDLQFLHEYGSGSNVVAQTSNSPIQNGVTHHICAKRDTVLKEISLYVDGAKVLTSSYTQDTTGGSLSRFRIGFPSGTGANGVVDDVLIFNKTLSDYDINYLYNKTLEIPTLEYSEAYDHNKLSLAGSGTQLTSVDIPAKDFTLDLTGNVDTEGTNILTANEPIGNRFQLEFYRTSNGPWQNDVFTDASLSIYLFFKKIPGEISYQLGATGYYSPIVSDNAIKLSLRKSITNKSRLTSYIGGTPSEVDAGTVTPWLASDIDGTNKIVISFVRNDYGKLNIAIFSNGNLREIITTPDSFQSSDIADGTVLFHHHNYNNDPTNYEYIKYLTLRNTVSLEVTDDYLLSIFSDSPVAYYRMDDAGATDTTMLDSGPNQLHGTFSNTNTVSSDGIVDTSIRFDKTTSGIVPDSTFFDFLTGLTLELWYYPEKKGSGAYFLVKQGTTFNWGIYNAGNSLDIDPIFYLRTSSGLRFMQPSVPITNRGRWYHIVCTYDRVNMRIYVDGQLSNIQAETGTITQHPGDLEVSGFWTGEIFEGKLDEVAIFDHAISASSVNERYLMGINSVAQDSFYGREIAKLDPVTYYQMEETSGTKINDSTVYDNDGTATGGFTLAAGAGISGTSMSFNGTSSRIQTGSMVGSLKGALFVTVSVWLKINQYPTQNAVVTFIPSNGNVGSTNPPVEPGHSISLTTTGKIVFKARGYTNSLVRALTSVATLPVGEWVNVVCVAEHSSATLYTYINGTLDSTRDFLTPNGSFQPSDTVTACIGGPLYANDYQGYYDGLMDEVAIFTSELNASKIFDLYNYGILPTYSYRVLSKLPTAYYKMDDGVSSVAADSTGNGYDGLHVNTTEGLTSIEFASTAFNGVDGLIQIPAGIEFESNNQSIEVWIAPIVYGNIYSYLPQGANEDYRGIALFAGPSSISFRWGREGANSFNDLVVASPGFIGGFNHLVVTMESGGDAVIYVNSTEVGRAAINGNISWTDSSAFSTSPNIKKASIGAEPVGSVYSNFFEGTMDEFAIYSKTLTQSEITDNYNSRILAPPNTHTFTLPYNVGRITLVEHDFQFDYTLNYISDIEQNYEFQYLLYREGVPVEYHFQLRYNLEALNTLVNSESPFEVEMISADLGFSTIPVEFSYKTTLVQIKTSTFFLRYKSKLDASIRTFNLRYKTNKEYSPVVYSLEKNTYKLSLVGLKSRNFKLRSRIGLVNDVRQVKDFNLRFKSEKGKVRTKEYFFLYDIAYANTYIKTFKLKYNTRQIPYELDTVFTFSGNSLSIEMDMTSIEKSAYRLFLDNGNRILGYELLTNFGQDIDTGPISVTYDYDISIPTYVPTSSEMEFSKDLVKYYDGVNGWSQLASDINYGEGITIAASALEDLPGKRPYSLTRDAHNIQIFNEGYYVFDYTTESLKNPELYIIDTNTNRVIKMGTNYDDILNMVRIVIYLPAGDYTLVAASSTSGNINSNSNDTTYTIDAFGPDFGHSQEIMVASITNYGYKLPEELDPGAVFDVRTLTLNVDGIDLDSSLSFAILNQDYGSLGVRYRSMLPRQELEEVGYDPELLVMSGNIMRAKIKVPNLCCFGKKLSLDDFESICSVPQLLPEKKSYSASTDINKRYTFSFDYEVDQIVNSMCEIEKTAIIIYDDDSKNISISRNLGTSWQSVGSIFSIFDHNVSGTNQVNNTKVTFAGSGGTFIATVNLGDA